MTRVVTGKEAAEALLSTQLTGLSYGCNFTPDLPLPASVASGNAMAAVWPRCGVVHGDCE